MNPTARFLLSLALGLAASGTLPSLSGTSRAADRTADELFADALKHYRASEYRKALEIVATIQRDSPSQVRFGEENLHNFKGSCLTALRYFQHARKEFEKALASQPESFDMKYNIAEMDFLQEHFSAARTKFTELQSTDQGRLYSEFLAFKVSMCLIMEGKKDAALESLDLHGRHTPIHIFINTAIAFRDNQSDEAEILLTLAREKIRDSDFALYEDSLIECGLLDPPQLPKAQQEELEAALRKPISLGTDRTYPTPTPVPEATEPTETPETPTTPGVPAEPEPEQS